MPFELETTHALPKREELLALLPTLLAASGELTPRDPSRPFYVYESLSPAWSNIDFDPQLDGLGPLDRAFVERQIERAHREAQRTTPWPWVLPRLDGAALVGSTLDDDEGPWELLALEVPVVTIDRTRAVLRGQRQTATYAEDFEHWLTKENSCWIARR